MTQANIMEINGFKYLININTNGFPVITMSGDALKSPKSLSKYYTVDELSVSSFIQRKLYANTPDFFNDLFDTLYLKLDYSGISFDKIVGLFKSDEIANERKEYELDNEKYIQKIRNTHYAIWNAHCGIICMTENKTDDLMWAHYSNNEGFLVEFDHLIFPKNFGTPYQINYVPSNDMLKFSSNEIFLSIYINSLLKKDIWKYENEFRFLVHPNSYGSFLTYGRFSNECHDYKKESRLVPFPDKAIKKVIFGLKFFNNYILDSETRERKIDLNRKNGLIYKSLIDNLIENKISVEMIHINLTCLNLESKAIALSKISETIYKIE